LQNPIFFTDDDFTGTNFERPDFQSAWELVEAGRVKNFVVKDLSRFGRSNALVGYYTEYVMPKMDVRFIAIDDKVDDTTGESDIATQIQIMFNEHNPRETSKKVRAVLKHKGESGVPLATCPPYGYMKNPETGFWIVDEVAAEVVKQIFGWCMEGVGITLIAKRLTEAKVEIPRIHAANAGIRKCEQFIADPCAWNVNTIATMLTRREYLGHVVNFKTYRKSFKHKKQMFNDPSVHVVHENKHPPIIDQEVFDRVQQIRNSGKKRRSFSGRVNLFQGICLCADCKSRMSLACGATIEPTQDSYSCYGFIKKNKCCNSSHYIRRVVLEEMVLGYLQKVTAFASQYEDEFVQKLQAQNTAKVQKDLASDKKRLALSQKRILELDSVIAKLFEKNATGVISDERFMKLSQGYECEQKELEVVVETLETELAKQQEMRLNTDSFLAQVKKYTRITELSTTMINELVERLEVHAPDKSSGKRTLKVDVYFNFIGKVGNIWE
jgi:DNA invertase Pin-like site-specific DNA recombinase